MGDNFFSFTVAEDMRPGDVLRARTPTGVLLEVKVPEGAKLGDIVQFALPLHTEEPDVVATPRSAGQVAIQAKFKSDVPVNVRDIGEYGITNARPKRMFCVKLPTRTEAGQSVLVDLPRGERVTVTVPSRAKPGRELSFCIGDTPLPKTLIDVRIK
eukprot:scaffold129553_cov36-Tisochrysis_lutea.AAC.6